MRASPARMRDRSPTAALRFKPGDHSSRRRCSPCCRSWRSPSRGPRFNGAACSPRGWYALPADADKLVAEAGSGQYCVGYGFGGRGMPLVDDSFWDVGVTITGSERTLEYAAGMVMGTPSWAATGQDDNAGKSFLG